MLSAWSRWRRRGHREGPLPEGWDEAVQRHAHWARSLPPEQAARLQYLVRVFLAEVEVEGCGGFEVTPEVRLVLALAASRLLLGLEIDAYPDLRVVRVYPRPFRAPVRRSESGVVHEGTETRLGESWQRGVVVLAWSAVLRGLQRSDDGKDVTLHEFAHQLDTADGSANGAPVLDDPAAYREWAHALGLAYADLRRAVERGRNGALDAYGATNPAEFFAVASEAFFETPAQLSRREPAVYAALKRFYRQNPLGD